MLRSLGIGGTQHNRKFLASETSHEVGGAYGLCQTPTDDAQQLVPDAMSARVIDLLEASAVITVHHLRQSVDMDVRWTIRPSEDSGQSRGHGNGIGLQVELADAESRCTLRNVQALRLTGKPLLGAQPLDRVASQVGRGLDQAELESRGLAGLRWYIANVPSTARFESRMGTLQQERKPYPMTSRRAGSRRSGSPFEPTT
jgi:hypothetical protein